MSANNSHFFRMDKKFFGIFVFIVALFGVVVLFRSQAANQNPPAPAVYLTPTNVTYSANQTFTVNLRENSGSTPVYAVAAKISYPANLLEFQNISTTNTAFPTVVPSATYGGNGEISLEAGAAAGGAALTGDNYIATITFRTLTSSGTANLDFTSGTQLLESTNFTNILSASDMYGAGFTVDTTAPSVSVTSPTNNASIARGTTATVTVSASDNSSVSAVDVLVDGQVKTTLSSTPYNYSLNTSDLNLGTHTIQAIARDPHGNTGSSQLVNVSIVDRTAPTVTLTSPTNDATAAGSISLAATAADDNGGTGVSRVEFYVNDGLVGTDTTSPYSFSWDSTSVADGTYTIYAKAYDKASPANTKTTNNVKVNVDNTDDVPPTAPGNLRETSASLDSITLAWNASTDNEGVAGYRISRNGSVITTVNTLTHTDTNLTEGTTYNYTVTAIDAAGNSSSPSSLTASTSQLKVGDFDKDGQVTLGDLALLLSKWNQVDSNIDLDNSGKVDLVDLAMFLSNYPRNN